jgi:hypothetical protein
MNQPPAARPVTPQPADILAVRTPGLAATLIRFGEALSGKPSLDNHIVLVHHQDQQGRWWGIEGRPGGVGWCDIRPYLASRQTVNNCAQSRPGQDARQRVCAAAAAMLGTPYDWEAITDDALRAFRMQDLWSSDWGGAVPGHVVCSSYTAFLYQREGWKHPDVAGRDTEPADWTAFCTENGYNTGLPSA